MATEVFRIKSWLDNGDITVACSCGAEIVFNRRDSSAVMLCRACHRQFNITGLAAHVTYIGGELIERPQRPGFGGSVSLSRERMEQAFVPAKPTG